MNEKYKTGYGQEEKEIAGTQKVPREIERLLEEQQAELEALSDVVNYLETRLYSVTIQCDDKESPEMLDTVPKTELGNALNNSTSQIRAVASKVNRLVRNCELP